MLCNPIKKSLSKRPRLQAVILDWSGTCADNFVIAPTKAFVDTFNHFRVPISMTLARKPMGLLKSVHIAELLKLPKVANAWKMQYNRYPNAVDIDKMMEFFTPHQINILKRYSDLIPGTAETIKCLRRDYKVRIGMTTGFQRIMANVLLQAAKDQGFVPDVDVSGDEVTKPRPWPYMIWKNLELLGIQNPALALKVGDTLADAREGVFAGCWTAAVYGTSNYMNINKLPHGLSLQQIEKKQAKSRNFLQKSGAHYVVRDITEIPHVVQDINKRLARGDRPY